MDKEPEQTLGFHRIVQRAFIHAQSSEKAEIQGSDLLVAMYREQQCYARYLLEAQDISRFDLINYVSHGVSKLPEEEPQHSPGAEEDEEGGQGSQRDPLQAFTVELVEKASKGAGGPAHRPEQRDCPHPSRAMPAPQEQPIYVGDPRRGERPPSPRDWPLRIHEKSVPEALLENPHLRPGHGRGAGGHQVPRRVRGAAEGHHHRAQGQPRRDPVHRRDPHRGRRRRHQRRLSGTPRTS